MSQGFVRVVMIDANSDEVKEFKSKAEAARYLGIDSWHIHAALYQTKGGSRLLENMGISFELYEDYYDLKPIREHKTKMEKAKRDGRKRRVNALDYYTHEIIDTYDSITEASFDCDISVYCIILSCQNKKRSAGGYKWEYAD